MSLRAIGLLLVNGFVAALAPSAALFSARPTASANTGRIMRFTDVGCGQSGTGGGTFMFSNGARWKPLGPALLDAIDTPNSGVANTAEQQLSTNHVAIPAGVISVDGDRIEVLLTLSKSGASDSATIRIRFGPLGTVADPVITTITNLAGASQSYGTVIPFKRVSATSLQKQGNSDPSSSLLGAGTGAYPAAVTVSDMGATPMFMSVTQQMTGGSEFVTAQDYSVTFKPTDNG